MPGIVAAEEGWAGSIEYPLGLCDDLRRLRSLSSPDRDEEDDEDDAAEEEEDDDEDERFR